MQGWRISMEDAHATILDLKAEGDKSTELTTGDKRLSFFGVYDGHGGDKVAIYAGEYLHKIIAKQEGYKSGDLEKALKDGFLATDRAILNDPKYEEEVSGCTACVGVLTNNKIFCSNAGDSRAVLGIKGRAKPLSFDHKPQNDSERARITAAGGFVDFGRVNGNLALSRAIGDFEFKKTAELPPEQQIVTAFPDVTEHEVTEDDEFVVIACDGIWDCQSSQAVIEFVRRGIVAKQELSSICENLMDNCLARTSDTGGVGCDNMTVIVVALLQGKTKEQWYQDVADRVAKGDGPCAPPEFAEHRGPGMRADDNHEDFDMSMDLDHRPNQLGGGRLPRGIILLGDGSGGFNITTSNENDADMFDQDEDKDLEEQVTKGTPSGSEDEGEAAEERSRREETPAPTSSTDTLPAKSHTEASTASSVADKKSESETTKTTDTGTKTESKP
ncbi:PP2C-domain-containing protein [Microthyrium microscopicum]|uniref:Protein phosphatase 2C homolog 2 n=1 Tax=Microthyrium microscopicum TaxID=703497 RepID=A0A6A6U0K4_9PEZI|nr:PP2C-domain-containing protein [Microthyrium microscopicum]